MVAGLRCARTRPGAETHGRLLRADRARAGHNRRVPSSRRPATPRPGAGGPRTGGTPRVSAPRTGGTPRVGPTPRATTRATGTGAPRTSPTRPASARPASRTGSTPARGVPRAEQVQVRVPRLFTARVMVLGVVLMIAFVLVFPTLRSYLTQRVELEQLNAQVEDARARNEDLTAAVARWSDDAYVIAQARERLAFVLPGETAYRVEDPESAPSTATDPEADVPGTTTGSGESSSTPWYSAIWDSVRIADEVEADPATSEQVPSDVPAP